ncbi:hypothetical protein [Parasphingorhabdus sp.]|uniref:hypothetical protein n=1 Tax=Parasphingorhabdus sp. TaxID=2709688 RepID=UPI003593B372
MDPHRPDPRSRAVQDRRISRIPDFSPVPLCARADGWTPLRQAEFLGYLAETRCIKTAAERVGMSRESAYRLRRKPGAEEFVAAWDVILGVASSLPAKVTLDGLFRRIRLDRYRPMLRGGKYFGTIRKPDNRAVLKALARLDRIVPPEHVGGKGPEGDGK